MKTICLLILMSLIALPSIAEEDSNQRLLSEHEITQLTQKIAQLIKQHYVFEDKGEVIAHKLVDTLREEPFTSNTSVETFATKTTKILRQVSGDKHLYINEIMSSKSTAKDWQAQEKQAEIIHNFGFEQVAIEDGNIGYLKISRFMHPQRAFDKAASAMKLLDQVEAIVIDLRDNPGGYGGIAELITSWFFDPAPTHILTTVFSDPSATPFEQYTLPFVPTERLVGLPVYILINKKTASAAEFVAYTLQSFNKAIIVGERSMGAAHRNSYFALNSDIRISISTGAPINPKTNTSWELTGVIPDVEIEPTNAKKVALTLAREAQLD